MLSPTVIGVVLHLLGLKSNFGQVEVQRGEAELDFNLAEMDLTEVARGEPALTPLKATESKSKFNEAQPS